MHLAFTRTSTLAMLAVAVLAGVARGQFVPPPHFDRFPLRYEIQGAAVGDLFGWSSAALGDVDGDGLADFAVGAPDADASGPSSGTVTVHSAVDGQVLFTLVGAGAGERSGFSLAVVGDLDGDAVADLAVGAPGLPNGRVRVHSGAGGALLHDWTGDANGDQFGRAVVGIGDVDGDGIADVAVGAPAGGSAFEGYVRAFSGLTGATLWTVFGGPPQGTGVPVLLGLELKGGIDVGGDGLPDVLATGSAAVRVLDAATGGGTSTIGLRAVDVGGDVNADGAGDLVGWSGTDLVVLEGVTLQPLFVHPLGAHDFESAAFVGDLNGDGHDEYASATGSGLAATSTEVSVFSGVDGSSLWSLTSDPGMILLGRQLIGLGDVNGDRIPDLLISSPFLLTPFGPDVVAQGMVSVFSLAGRRAYGVGADPNQFLELDWEPTWVSDPTKGRLVATGPAGSNGVLVVGFTPTTILFQDVTVLVLTFFPHFHVSFAFDAVGRAATPVNLRDPALHGTTLYLQVIQANPSASMGLAGSNGLELIFSR